MDNLWTTEIDFLLMLLTFWAKAGKNRPLWKEHSNQAISVDLELTASELEWKLRMDKQYLAEEELRADTV